MSGRRYLSGKLAVRQAKAKVRLQGRRELRAFMAGETGGVLRGCLIAREWAEIEKYIDRLVAELEAVEARPSPVDVVEVAES